MFYNISTKICSLLLLSLLIISCSSDDESISMNENTFNLKNGLTATDKDAILSDVQFLDLVKSEYYFYKNADKVKIKEIVADEKIDPSEAQDISVVFGFKSTDDFNTWQSEQKARWTYVEDKYKFSSLTEHERTDLWLGALEKQELPPIVEPTPPAGSNPPYETLMSCNAKFNWCTAGAMAGAGLLHFGCLGADATSAGLAAFVCHGLVVTAQSAAHAACQAAYDDCVESENES